MLLQSQYFAFDLYGLVKRGNYILKLFRNLSLIAKGKASRFACLLLPNQPHTPWNKGDVSQFDPDKLTLATYVCRCSTNHVRSFTMYLAEVNFMDQEFGNVLSIWNRKRSLINLL